MHTNELKTHPTLMNYDVKKYKLEQGSLGPIGQYWIPHNQILKLTQHLITKSQLHYSTLCILQ